MTDELTAEQVIAKIVRAEQEVADLCTGKHRWTMWVPAEPDNDSDLLIGGALADARAFIRRVAAREVAA